MPKSVTQVKMPDNRYHNAFVRRRRRSTSRKASKPKSRKKSGRRRSSKKRTTKRRRSTTSTKRTSRGKCIIDNTDIVFLNSIIWDVTKDPETSSYLSQPLNMQDLNKTVCSGKLKLLVPAAFRDVFDSLSVLYEVHINKKNVTVGDILNALWKFYNVNRVTKEDLKNLLLVESKHDKAKGLLDNYRVQHSFIRFKDFLEHNTLFNGLIAQDAGAYLVRIAPNVSSPMPAFQI